MIDLVNIGLQGMLAYGAPALALALLLGALGMPLPSTMLLVAAGALARQGMLDWPTTIALAWLGVVLGDSSSYLLGRYGGWRALRRVEDSAAWRRALAAFSRGGGLAILLTRFLLTPLCMPISLIAGSSRYAFRRFLAFDVAGELVWVLLYGGLGYLFADQWELLGDLASTLGGVLAGLLVLGGGAYLVYRRRRRGRPEREEVPACTVCPA